MSLKICQVRGTASESREPTTISFTPDPLGDLNSIVAPIVSLTTPPALQPEPSVELTWAPADGGERSRASDELGFGVIADHLEDSHCEGTGSKTTEVGQEATTATEDQLLQLRQLDRLTETTLAHEALISSSSPEEVNVAMEIGGGGDLETPAILFDDVNDYFDLKKEEEEIKKQDDDSNQNESDPKEVIMELDLPVTSGNFASLWESQVEKADQENAQELRPTVKEQIEAQAIANNFSSAPNPMACFNPLHVEGKMEASAEEKPKKKTRKALRLYIPPPEATTEEEEEPEPKPSTSAPLIDTPSVERALGAAATGDEGSFDLLEWVTNTELPVNDPGFLALISDTGASASSSPSAATAATAAAASEVTTLDLGAIGISPTTVAPAASAAPSTSAAAVPKGKKLATTSEQPVAAKAKQSRRRPQASAASTSTGGDHSYMSATQQPRPSTSRSSNNDDDDDDGSALSADDVREAKYRRMRDLNNLASKRCRQNRKRKFESLLEEEETLRQRNAELRMKCRHMEDLVSDLKRQFIQRVSNPGSARREPVDLDELMAQRLGGM